MPWSNQSGGGWKGGGGGPWGPRQSPGQQPDLEEILRRSQDRLRQAIPGGRMGGPLAVLFAVVAVALIGFFGFTVRVNPDELGIVLRFGEYVRQLPPGLNFRWPYPDRAGRAAESDAHQPYRDRHARLLRQSRRFEHDPRRARGEPDADR